MVALLREGEEAEIRWRAAGFKGRSTVGARRPSHPTSGMRLSRIGGSNKNLVAGGADQPKKSSRLSTTLHNIADVVTGHHKEAPAEAVDTPWRIEDAHGAWSLSDDGATVYHERKGHDLGLPDIVLKTGVTKISMKVIASHNNKGHNIFLGVMDADAPREAPTDGASTKRGGTPALGTGKAGEAWGYHPYDGMLYYTADAYQRGAKGAAAGKEGEPLRELPHMRGDAEGQVLHMVIDMDNKKLLMAVNNMEAVDMGIQLPASVMPYVFFDWRDDAVELLGNVVPTTQRQPSHRHKDKGKTTNRKGGGVLTARAQALKGSNHRAPRDNDGRTTGPSAAVTEVTLEPAPPPKQQGAPPPPGGFTDALRFDLAINALMAVQRSDPIALANAVPGFSLGDPTRELMIKELERLHDKIGSLEA